MVTVLKDEMLEFNPHTLEEVRKEVNLDSPGRIEEAVDILDNWVKKNQHFVKKDFSREYLERTLIMAKGLVERAKQRIDRLCTFKTIMPELYPSTVSRKDYETLHTLIQHAYLPKLTKENYRVYMFNVKIDEYTSQDIQNFYRNSVVMCEYLRIRDYNSGFIAIIDYRNLNILNYLAKCSPMELRQMMTLVTEGYSLRLKQIHIITASKMVDALLAFTKQVFSPKLVGRIHLHKDLDTLYDFVPKHILPEEYGGTEKSLQECDDAWIDAITNPDFVEYFEEMYKAKTDESYRQSEKFTEQYIGMPGSFRALSVD